MSLKKRKLILLGSASWLSCTWRTQDYWVHPMLGVLCARNPNKLYAPVLYIELGKQEWVYMARCTR